MPGITDSPYCLYRMRKGAHPKSIRVLNVPVVQCLVNLGFLRLSPCFHWVLPLSTLNTNMAKALTKSQIVASLAETVGLTKKQAVQTLEALVALAYKNAKNSFTIPGLGKIVLVNRKARMGRNPATGETIKIAAKRVVKFRVAKAAKDAILGSK